ncbi:MAG: type I CRISPR-associated protein Cas7, partial [bacterium]|nr:type I CRISPR-associated protein Cas7 [bacterium]
MAETNGIVRATGLLVIEVINSNPNGDPDRESDPRQRPDGRGEISPVSFKRKIRDLVETKEGPVWKQIAETFHPPLSAEQFVILESRGRDRKAIEKEIKDGLFQEKYWDGRVFGNTFLEKEGSDSIRTVSARPTHVPCENDVSHTPRQIERMCGMETERIEEDENAGTGEAAGR